MSEDLEFELMDKGIQVYEAVGVDASTFANYGAYATLEQAAQVVEQKHADTILRDEDQGLYWAIANADELEASPMFQWDEDVEVVENPSKVSVLSKMLDGTHVMEPTNGLKSYHAAREVIGASRMKDAYLRNSKIKSLLKNFRVVVSMQGDATRIYRPDTQQELIIGGAQQNPFDFPACIRRAKRKGVTDANAYCAVVDRRMHQNPENAPELVSSVQGALQAGRPIWVRTHAGAWGVREIKLSSDKRQALVKMGRQSKWTWLTGQQLEDLARQAGKQNPSLRERASEKMHPKGNPQWYQVRDYRGYPERKFDAAWRKAHGFSPSPTGHNCDFVSAAEAERAANLIHIRGQRDHVVAQVNNPSLRERASELYKDAAHFLTKGAKSKAALKRLREAETKTGVRPTKFGLGGKRNPEGAADALYESFHGRPPSESVEVTYQKHLHENLTALGDLVQIQITTPFGKQCTINVAETKNPKVLPDVSQLPRDQRVLLCSSEDGKQLYFLGGSQDVDVHKLGFSNEDVKDSMLLGVIEEITYQTEKEFDNYERISYYHKLGEESGVQPVLIFDPISELLSVSGGRYVAAPEGLRD